jgi:predicted nucleotidyltransferase
MPTIEEITQKLIPVFEEEGVTKAIIFGSYAKGNAGAKSDVDLVIDTEPHLRGWDVWAVFDVIRETLEEMELDLDIIHRREIIIDGAMDKEVAETGRVIYVK